MNIEPWLGAIIGVGGIGIGLVSSLIAITNRLVKVETKQDHHSEEIRKIGSAVFKNHADRIRDLEVATGNGNVIRIKREDERA